MAHNITTSIRLSPELRAQLEDAAQSLHRGKNWIVVHALEDYLEKLHFTVLASEARRQSLLACQADRDDDTAQSFEDNTDTTGWE